MTEKGAGMLYSAGASVSSKLEESGVKGQFTNMLGAALETGKAVGSSALETGKYVGSTALETGMYVGSTAIETGKYVSGTVIETGKNVGSTVLETGKQGVNKIAGNEYVSGFTETGYNVIGAVGGVA